MFTAEVETPLYTKMCGAGSEPEPKHFGATWTLKVPVVDVVTDILYGICETEVRAEDCKWGNLTALICGANIAPRAFPSTESGEEVDWVS